HLEVLLKRKLSGIPSHHVPDLQLSDIISQTPRALLLHNIPPDIQLAFLLRNRALIDQHSGKPIKAEDKQSLDITRAIWYYRLDAVHQFQRYHDTARWNIALYTALLSLPLDTTPPASPTYPSSPANTRSKDTYIPPAARRFMTLYLAAVLEHHHHTPNTTTFTAREAFIKVWKSGIWDVFEVHSSGQKKLLKNEMKRLTREWELELDRAMGSMERAEYQARIARFVGSLFPGRKDQGLVLPAYLGKVTPSLSPEVQMGGDVDVDTVLVVKEEGEASNELLEALCVPLDEQSRQKHTEFQETTVVTDIRYAIGAVNKMHPRDMLLMLMRLFP
ncbi:uncharacterized protein K460DRAFT_239526, partial [Cucurbitaria berberidis CBS 394.84]